MLRRCEAGDDNEESGSINLLDAVEERIANVPPHSISDCQLPREGRLVEIDKKADHQVPEEDVFVVEARAGEVEEGRQPREKES